MSKKQIIAIGGGGFSEEPDNPVLDEYFLKQTGKRNPSVCFIPTATGDADGYIVKFYTAFNKFRCRPCHLSLFRPPKDLADFVLSQDAIYVGGGVTRNLLALWREWDLDKFLRKAWRQGTLLGGISAGSLCWFEEGLSQLPGRFMVVSGLGLIKGSNTSHYNRPERRRAFRQRIGRGTLSNGVAADDGVAFHYIDTKLVNCVSSRHDVAAYRVSRVGGRAQEEKIEVRYLGGRKGSTRESNRRRERRG